MNHIIDFLDQQHAITRTVMGGDSVLLFAPRYTGKHHLTRVVERQVRQTPGMRFVRLSSRSEREAAQVDFGTLWREMSTQLGLQDPVQVAGVVEFEAQVQAALNTLGERVVVTLTGAGRGHEEQHHEVLAAFHRRLRAEGEARRLVVLAADDYSTYLFSRTSDPSSEWPYYAPVHWLPLDPPDLVAALPGFLAAEGVELAPEAVAEMAEQLVAATGGHLGLIQEILAELRRKRSWATPGAADLQASSPIWRGSNTLQAIHRGLEDDALGYSQTALEYEEPSHPERSVRVDVLRQMGVLQRVSAAAVRLCPGVITGFIREIEGAARDRKPRLGTVTSEQGERVFVAGQLDFTDDDFVVVHISDLHIGEKHRFKLAWGGGTLLNPHEPHLADLLMADLEELNVARRVDALVVSGDVTWLATPGEFMRARSVLEEMLERLGLGMDRLCVIPGNHDVEWHPGPLAEKTASAVSRENYENFVELVRRDKPGDVGLVTVPSRSGGARLRLLELDSNHVEGPEAGGIGYVSPETLEEAERLLAANPPAGGETVYTWLVVHHHVFPVNRASVGDAARRHVSVMANSSEILEFAARNRAEVILHGHEHQPSVCVSRRWPVDRGDPFRRINVIGAGSVGIARDELGPFSKNHYFLICRRKDGLIIRSRRLGDTSVSFVTHADMHLNG